jgi:signal transduction histidine kinase/CheY-like chemotaxis protein
MRLLRTYFDRHSIRFKLFRLVVMVATATLLMSMAGGALFEWNNQQKQVRQSLATIAQAAGVAASAAVVFQDANAAADALRILTALKDIEAAAVYPLEGYRLASYGETARLPSHVDQAFEHRPSFSLFASSTTLFQPIVLDDAAIGYIFIRASLRDARFGFLVQISVAIAANLLGLMLVLRLGLPFLDSIVKPVKQLADTSRQVRTDKNFSLRAQTPAAGGARDEIGELITSFNAMLAEIEQRERDLARYQSGLERTVQERTEALVAANAELQTAKEAAEAATVAKSRFLAAASHDLRQPMQAISLFQNALNSTGLNPEQKRISDYLSLSAQSLGDLLNALLDISKLDAGAVRANPQPIDVAGLLASIDAAFAPLASAKSLRFNICFPQGDLALFADGQLLQSLLRNLVGNALKYTERGGVLVAVRRRGDAAVVQVWDTGIGIAPEHMKTIFDEYFQVANPERDKAKGLGLGLSIAKRQAELMGTQIACRSRLGHGSVFEFCLPIADPPPEESGACDPAADAPRFAACRVALIEDNSMVAMAMRMALESRGISVAAYRTAEAALEDAAITQADCYISDFRLPGTNGIELLEAIERLAGRPIKAILMTGETSPDRIELAQSARWPVLFKPVDLRTLLATLESHLLRARPTEEEPSRARDSQDAPAAATSS